MDQPTGLCQCGCGQPTRIAPYSDRKKGWRRGQPVRFISGHNTVRHGYKIEDRGHDTPCWIWQGKPRAKGYGRIRVDQRTYPAHRYFYERARGPIPDGLQLDHLCRVLLCVNPDHLEPVTAAENIRRGSMAKLSASDAAEIRAFRDRYFAENPTIKSGRPRKRFAHGVVDGLAEQYGVSRKTVMNVLAGVSWL